MIRRIANHQIGRIEAALRGHGRDKQKPYELQRRLCSDAGIKLRESIKVMFNYAVTLAGHLGKAGDVENPHLSTRVFDESLFLQNARCHRNGGTGASKHLCEKLMRYLERVRMCAISTDQQPTRQTLLEVVLRIASGGLHGLNKLRLNIPQSQFIEIAAKRKLAARDLDSARIAVASDLRVDTIQALFGSHQRRNAYNRLVAEHPYLDLRPIAKGRRHRRHSLFEEIEVIDRAARMFDFPHQLEYHWLQPESVNGIRI